MYREGARVRTKMYDCLFINHVRKKIDIFDSPDQIQFFSYIINEWLLPKKDIKINLQNLLKLRIYINSLMQINLQNL